MKRLLSLFFALALATSLSFAQSSSGNQSSTDQSTTTTSTTTTKSKKSKVGEAASATGEAAKGAASATAEGTEKAASATAKGTKKAAKKTKETVTGETSSKKIDLNSATKDELATLPGVGDATAQKIIDGRPYRAKNELVSKNVVSQSEYDQIKDQVIAHHAKTSTTASASTDSTAASGSVSSSTGSPKKSTKPATTPK